MTADTPGPPPAGSGPEQPTTTTPQVRPATPADTATLLALVRDLAAFELSSGAVRASEADLSAALFGPDPVAEAYVAARGGEVAGMAVTFRTFSTWTGRPGLHVEDLFVDARHRGRGVGRALLAHLAGVCLRRGYARLEWAVLDWNAPAISFYERLGARHKADWLSYRLEGPRLAELAGLAGPGAGEVPAARFAEEERR